MLSTLYLIRHGEVHNPRGVVYADLPGFGLSSVGLTQAEAAAERLASERLDAIVASPLDRARQTAAPIANRHGLDVAVDERLTEWAIARRWADAPWNDLPTLFPGELEAYLETPAALAFAQESIGAVAQRMGEVIAELDLAHPGGAVAVVSHQDPVQALRLHLCGADLTTLHTDKPGHGTVITLERRGESWDEASRWDPDVGSAPFPPVEPPEAT